VNKSALIWIHFFVKLKLLVTFKTIGK
jgi:hypothetical protein